MYRTNIQGFLFNWIYSQKGIVVGNSCSFEDIYKNMTNLFYSVDFLPQEILEEIKRKVFNIPELKTLIQKVKNKRAPRFVLIGDSGAGKSTLINAIAGYYAVQKSDVHAGTKNAEHIHIKDEDGKTLWEFLDTRGVSEQSKTPVTKAEDQLINDINTMSPDAIVYVRKADDRTNIDSKLAFLKNITEKMYETKKVLPSIIVVSSQCNKLTPSSICDPKIYTKNKRKMANIKERENQLEKLFREHSLNVKTILSTSALVEWSLKSEKLIGLSKKEQMQYLKIDYRYNIDLLREMIMDSLQSESSKISFSMFLRVRESLAEKITEIFADVSSHLALSPMSAADILSSLRVLLVMFIAVLSGQKLSRESADEKIALFYEEDLRFSFFDMVQEISSSFTTTFFAKGSVVSAKTAAEEMKLIGSKSREFFNG
ncbi:ATP-binding cassette domain-containing protein [Treponema phagedenis]|nr:ATP-binding cassette domain-containing protein [Treponema phagedenis]QEK05625.1 ATP-binding cassette domain-containing protein [Treponema phagedenis]